MYAFPRNPTRSSKRLWRNAKSLRPSENVSRPSRSNPNSTVPSGLPVAIIACVIPSETKKRKQIPPPRRIGHHLRFTIRFGKLHFIKEHGTLNKHQRKPARLGSWNRDRTGDISRITSRLGSPPWGYCLPRPSSERRRDDKQRIG